jgi:D-amino-acid oxidase
MARVLVVGAGVVGLSCAVRLLEAGHRVDVVARDLPLETSSAVAGALWYPPLEDPDEQVRRWSLTGRTALAQLADDAGSGVRLLPGTELHRERTPDPWWRAAVPDLTRVAAPPPYADAWSCTAPVVDMAVHLPWLASRVEACGGTLTRMALAALPDGSGAADAVVDASGLGARRMAGDLTVRPVRGQVLHLEPVGEVPQRWWLDRTGQVYVVPRSRVIVVGATAEEGEWDRRPDPAAAERLRDRAVDLVPDLARARVVGHRVGLRPARPRVRLELEPSPPGSVPVVHCYGHGDAGVTLSWGCAEEVTRLVGSLP